MDRVKGALKEAASYSDALARDGRLRSDLRAAIGHGSVASQRIRRDFAAGRITTRLARDRKLRRNVRELFHDLERASERIQNRHRSHRVRNALLLIGGTGAVVAAVPSTRRWVTELATSNGNQPEAPPYATLE
jgi:hypothetical protein